MIRRAAHLIDNILWAVTACSAAYVAFFAAADRIARRRKSTGKTNNATRDDNAGGAGNECKTADGTDSKRRFLVIFPAYSEDKVITSSVERFLRQDYPAALYDVTVVSDHQQRETDEALRRLGVTVLTPSFKRSTKAAALQYAVRCGGHDYDYVVVLDADNVTEASFLTALDTMCGEGHKVVQCHRQAKNRDTDVSALDGVSEEINNTLFRSAHNAVGLSASLIGSGMCIDYDWFAAHVGMLTTAGEDRELEALLLADNIYIKYAEDIPVYDEKVSDADNFARQRGRWLAAQLHSLVTMLPHIPHAIRTRNVNYIDKTIQQALVPRSMLVVAVTTLTALSSVAAPGRARKWQGLLAVLLAALSLAVPSRLRTRSLAAKGLTALKLTGRMFKAASHATVDNGEFTHTRHDK